MWIYFLLGFVFAFVVGYICWILIFVSFTGPVINSIKRRLDLYSFEDVLEAVTDTNFVDPDLSEKDVISKDDSESISKTLILLKLTINRYGGDTEV